MENKIWYLLPNERNYLEIPGILYIQANTFCSLENTIQASIDSFNRNVVWDDMWDINEAKSRLEKGNILFIGLDHEGTLAHVWFEDNYLYNLYVDPRRPQGYGESFIKGCLNFIPFHTISLYVDEGNIKAQKFFEKVGAHKISSYI